MRLKRSMWNTVGERTSAATNEVQRLRRGNIALFKYGPNGQMQFYRLSNHLAAPAAAAWPP